MEEQWKDVYFIENGIEYDYRGLYQVSSEGRVKSLGNGNSSNSKERILKAGKNKYGYLRVGLLKNGKRKNFFVHRLALYMFDPDGYFEGADVNHIDENKENNCVDNLEWCTRKYNNNHGTHNKRAAKTKSKKIIGYSLTSTKVIILQGTRQAEKFGFSHGNISKACRGKYFGSHEYKGYKWYYMN